MTSDTATPTDPEAREDAAPPSHTPHGRSGQGTASIMPHLNRQQQINDKPGEAPDEDELPTAKPPPLPD